MNEIDLIISDYLFFLIFILFLALVIVFGVKSVVLLIEIIQKVGVIRI
jgi:hypothetical protein